MENLFVVCGYVHYSEEAPDMALGARQRNLRARKMLPLFADGKLHNKRP